MLKELVLTIDVDMVDYSSMSNWKEFDELEVAFSRIQKALVEFPNVKTTWFIRIDSQIEAHFGSSLYVFDKHASKLNWLLENGHSLGWHHHCYKQEQGRWVQEDSLSKNIEDVQRYGELARKQGLSVSRMGWGYMSNEIISTLEKLGFRADSTAIPRPNYPWEKNSKDWSTTPSLPYFPSVDDYRIPASGGRACSILEIPMSVAYVPAPGDTVKMMRYVNPAYDLVVFEQALSELKNLGPDVLIMHPYEIFLERNDHALFESNSFEKNLQRCAEHYHTSMTLESWVDVNH